MKLDVVSLAEAKSMTDSEESSKHFDPMLKSQIKLVLNYVDKQLTYIPHTRRKEIALGEFMNRHHHLNSSSLQEFTNDILKNLIEKTLGHMVDSQAADVIDWEFKGHKTHPFV
jgi:hypothetical protein